MSVRVIQMDLEEGIKEEVLATVTRHLIEGDYPALARGVAEELGDGWSCVAGRDCHVHVRHRSGGYLAVEAGGIRLVLFRS